MANRQDYQNSDQRRSDRDADNDTTWHGEDARREPRNFSGEQSYGRPGQYRQGRRGDANSYSDEGQYPTGTTEPVRDPYRGDSRDGGFGPGGYSRESGGGGYGPRGYGAENWGQGRGTYGQRDYSEAARRDQWRDDQRFGDHRSTGETWNAGNTGRDEHYGASQRSNEDHHHEPHYRRWRDERLAGHDRDYARWREEQIRRYDSDYGRWRDQKHAAFSQDFESWRGQQNDTAIGARGASAGHSGSASGMSDSGGGATGAAGVSGGTAGVPDVSGMGDAAQAFQHGGSGSRTGGGAAAAGAATGAGVGVGSPASTEPVRSVTDGGTGGEHDKDKR